MAERLKSPGIQAFESKGSPSNIRGSGTGTGIMIGIAEWGEIGRPVECISYPDFESKFGSFINGYYLAKSAYLFFQNGGSKLYVVRTAHYENGELTAVKSNNVVRGYNPEIEDREKVETIKLEARGEGLRGNKINISCLKAKTTLTSSLTGSVTSAAVESTKNFEIGDIIDIADNDHYFRTVITQIDEDKNIINFKSLTLTAKISSGADIKTCSTHVARTSLENDLVSNATSIEVKNISGISIGSIVTIIDTKTDNTITVKVTDISNNIISFENIGSITTIHSGNSIVVTQEFDLKVYSNVGVLDKNYTYLSMEPQNEKNYIENKVNNKWLRVFDLSSTEDLTGRIPEPCEELYLKGGNDGLTGLDENDFIGTPVLKNGLYAIDVLPGMFAQICCPDMRSANFQKAMINYAENKGLWCELDIDFNRTPDEVKEYVNNTAMFNTNYAELNYPNVLWNNPVSGVTETIPQSSATMGLNANVWGSLGKGPWIAAAGVEEGVYKGISGFENNYTDDTEYRNLLYESRVNALYRYPQYGNLKYGIRTLEVNGEFPQVPERVTFLYVRHSIINGTPWVVFKNIDTSTLQRLKKTVEKFLTGLWKAGALKGLDKEEAFIVDVSKENVNTPEREQAGELWCKIGLATKKAGEFVYFDFHKKIAG